VFQLGALVGPAVSGVLLTSVGAGWAFMLNACSYLPPIAVLLAMRRGDMYPPPEPSRRLAQLRQGFRFIVGRNDVLWPIALVGAFGFFTVSMPVTLATFAKAAFHSGARGYAFFSLMLAAGSLMGALSSAYRLPKRLRGLAETGLVLCACQIIAAAAPNTAFLVLALLPLGVVTLTFYTAASTIVQLASPDAMRGRVMSVYLLVFIGCGAMGGPCVGAIDQHLGPRMGLAIGCLASLLALCGISYHLWRVLSSRMSTR
jgi:MFS family permease